MASLRSPLLSRLNAPGGDHAHRQGRTRPISLGQQSHTDPHAKRRDIPVEVPSQRLTRFNHRFRARPITMAVGSMTSATGPWRNRDQLRKRPLGNPRIPRRGSPFGRTENPLDFRPLPAMEFHMSEPTTSTGDPVPPITEDEAIRQRVKGLTSQVLQQGRLDPEAVRDVVRTVIGRTPGKTGVRGVDAEELFADAVRELDDALMKSAGATHSALQQLASRGKNCTDNDLKEALVSLRKLGDDYEAAANRITEAMSGNLRREVTELAVHAQNIGVEASARVANVVGEFTTGMRATAGLATVRGAGVRIALLASGVLAGVADALRDQSETNKGQ